MPQSRLWVGVLIAIAVVLGFSVFTVHERQKAIQFQLGKIVKSDFEPGLHFKLPFVQNIRKYDARVQTLDSPPELYLTSEKKNVRVDHFVKWKIADVESYYKATGGNFAVAGQRLLEVIKRGLKDEFGKRTIQEVVSGERTDIMDILSITANRAVDEYGINIVDVRIKRIDLPEDVSESVYSRMQSERKEVAQGFRARGAEEAKRIRAKAEREREVMLAEAERDGLRLRGQGDAQAAEIYANAFGQDPEFFSLYRSLTAYRDTFSNKGDILLLDPKSDFFRYFVDPLGKQ
ncbi:MAG: protease modulator HflC [Gammaproteobacteria bacterium]|nr:protease modulator HflC [Gammaproteobacteria bacterium]